MEQLNDLRQSIHHISSITQRHDSVISALVVENKAPLDAETSFGPNSAAVGLLQINGHDLSFCRSDEERTNSLTNPILDQDYTSKIMSLSASNGDQSHSATQYPSSTEISELTSFVQEFFDKICPLFPIICDLAAMRMVSDVFSRGYKDDIETCLVLLLVAIGKESDNYKSNLGMDEFKCALSILPRVQYEFSLQFVQVEILAGIYLYRRFNLMESWKQINAGCTTLYVLIQR